MNNFKEFWRGLGLFWKEIFSKHKILFLSLCTFFVLGILSAFLIDENSKNELIKIIVEKLEQELPADAQGWPLFFYIWKNNIQVLLITFAFSFLLFIPFLIEFFNGLIISVVVAFSLTSITWGKAMLMILPHGIFELSFFFLGAFLAMLFWLKLYFPKKFLPELSRNQTFKKIFINFAIIIIGLGVSALIETWLTPFLAGVN